MSNVAVVLKLDPIEVDRSVAGFANPADVVVLVIEDNDLILGNVRQALDELRLQKEQQDREKQALNSMKGRKSETLDGRSIRICCNIGGPEDVSAVLENDGEGIGLFRSEFLYLNREDFPDEETQFLSYRQVLTQMGDREVIIRTMDIGADKKIGYFNLPQEENPAMGMRALRICLDREEIFRTQLRALYRASAYGRLGIMFPMVTNAWEVETAKALCAQVRQELTEEGTAISDQVPVGIMIETPAAALVSDQLAGMVDFFSWQAKIMAVKKSRMDFAIRML